MGRLYRSATDRVFGGVCGGLAAWLGVSPLVVRIVFMLLAMANGTGLAVYVALWLLVPREGAAGAPREQVVQENLQEISSQAQALGKTRPLSPDAAQPSAVPENAGATRGGTGRQWLLLFGAAFVALGVLVLLDNLGLLWWLSLGKLWPLVLIGLGVVVLLNNLRETR